ncbi:unnamed protein product [Closterium sp. NIES-53]
MSENELRWAERVSERAEEHAVALLPCPALPCPARSRCLARAALLVTRVPCPAQRFHAALRCPALPCRELPCCCVCCAADRAALLAASVPCAVLPHRPSVQESLSLQQLCERVIWWGSPGGGASRARAGGAGAGGTRTRRPGGRVWGATSGGTRESTPAGSATGRRGGSGGGQQQQQRPPKALSPQQLQAPGGVEAVSLGVFDAANAGAEPEKALHTFTLDSGASRCFFRGSTTVTPLTAPVPVTLADPSGGPVVTRGATVLPFLAAPSDLLIGLHLPSFAKNLVPNSVLQDQWVTITQPGGELVAICMVSRNGEHLATFTLRPGSGLYTMTTESALVAESGQLAASVEGGERYFLLVVDDYTRYTTVFPLQSKVEVCSVLICWIRAVRLELSTQFRQDLPVLWPRVSMPETLPTLHWTGEVGDVSGFWFYHLGSHHVLSSRDVTFDESVCFYRLHPHHSSPVPLPPLSLVVDTPPVAPLPPPGPAPSGVSQVDPPLLVEHLEVSSDTSGPAEGGDPTAADTPVDVDSGAAGGGDTGGTDSGVLALGWAVWWSSPGGSAGRAGARSPGDTGPRGASAGVRGVGYVGGTGAGGTGDAGGVALVLVGRSLSRRNGFESGLSNGATPVAELDVLDLEVLEVLAHSGGANVGIHGVGGTGGADTGGATGGTGVGGASRQESLSPQQLHEWAVCWGSPSGEAGGTGSGVLLLLELEVLGVRLLSRSSLRLVTFSVSRLLLLSSLLLALLLQSLIESREPASLPVMPVHTRHAVPPSPPPVPGTHIMALRPSSVPQRVVLPSPPASSLPHVPDPESDLVRNASPTVTCLLATVVTDPYFECATASALVAELVDFAALCRLDYAGSLVFYSSYPTSNGSELALGRDVLEDKHFELLCLAAAAPHLVSTLLCPEGDPDALDIPTLRSYADAITVARHIEDYTCGSSFRSLEYWPFTVLRTDTSLSQLYVLLYVDDLVFATVDTEALALVKAELQERHTCTDMGELQSYLGLQVTRDRARCTITLTQSNMVQQVLQRFSFEISPLQPTPLPTGHSLSIPPFEESVEPSGPYPELVGFLIYLMTCTRPDFAYHLSLLARYVALGSHRKLTYLLTDLGERPRSPPVLYVDNKGMIALCQDHRVEHRTKHIDLRYFLTRELLQRGQLRLAYVATQDSTADVFTKALGFGDHQRFCTALGLVPTLPHLLVS